MTPEFRTEFYKLANRADREVHALAHDPRFADHPVHALDAVDAAIDSLNRLRRHLEKR